MAEMIEQVPKQKIPERISRAISVLWYRLLVLLRLKPDWSNPEFAPPGLEGGIRPHTFKPSASLPCCVLCGGGRLHKIHRVLPAGPKPCLRCGEVHLYQTERCKDGVERVESQGIKRPCS